ncbi:tyrosine-type recombinase/integrase [Nocardia salmonicida]|uniref:tyrosine-type recombinase/integrase n=1 Tax=Nocardia salmonicida TaxID=53431 RepID=UPI003443E51A
MPAPTEHHAAAQAQQNTSSPPPDASTATPSKRDGFAPKTIPPAYSQFHPARPRIATPSPPPKSARSAKSPPHQATTPPSTPYSYASTSKPPAVAAAHSPSDYLDRLQCLVYLREKGGSDRWQPVSPTLMSHLTTHADHHQTPAAAQLLRYHHGRPITHRRYDYIWRRVGEALPWVATQGITTHWLRHTTLTWIERTFSYAVAQAFAGHRGKRIGTTDTYVKSHLTELAAAVSILTGEPHPLASATRTSEPGVLALRAPNRFCAVAASPPVVQDVSSWQLRGSWTTSCGQ